MRILLATEGESDEIVAGALIRRFHPAAAIDPKRFPARGFPTVQRLLPDVIRAAHFGFYDLLAVHFDLDDTLPTGARSVAESPRWQEIHTIVVSTIPALKECNRPAPLRAVLISTALSAILAWSKRMQIRLITVKA
jgi:hypothetical protein